MSRSRFVHDAMRALPPVPQPHGRHDFAIGAVIFGTAAAVAIGFWVAKRLRPVGPAHVEGREEDT